MLERGGIFLAEYLVPHLSAHLIPSKTEIKDTAPGNEDLKLPELMGPFPVHVPLTSASSPHVKEMQMYHSSKTFRKFPYFHFD